MGDFILCPHCWCLVSEGPQFLFREAKHINYLPCRTCHTTDGSPGPGLGQTASLTVVTDPGYSVSYSSSSDNKAVNFVSICLTLVYHSSQNSRVRNVIYSLLKSEHVTTRELRPNRPVRILLFNLTGKRCCIHKIRPSSYMRRTTGNRKKLSESQIQLK